MEKRGKKAMQAIIVFDKFGYGGHHTLVDVIRIAEGESDLSTFRSWLAEQDRSEEDYSYLSVDVRDLSLVAI